MDLLSNSEASDSPHPTARNTCNQTNDAPSDDDAQKAKHKDKGR